MGFYCCDTYERLIDEKQILDGYIYGYPEAAYHEYDDVIVDFTKKIEIFYCPFCGKKLEE